ncbi:hypothetical protein ACIBQ1_46510 [Nonomuraea sp. NPDC050153]|uniref:hypothetical protein n=1 Tax=Nonomuraea sp. NPDC050153 TaxID=3364359 RepID=UPI0037899763
MIRTFLVIVSALAVLLGGATAVSAAAGPPFCKGVKKPCVVGGDAGTTWVNTSASGKAQAKAVADRVLRNAKAAYRKYHAPEWVDIWVIKKGACWRRYGNVPSNASRACTYKHVERKLS